jgi:hypothetical protein
MKGIADGVVCRPGERFFGENSDRKAKPTTADSTT